MVPILTYTLIVNITWFLRGTGNCCRHPLVSWGMVGQPTFTTSLCQVRSLRDTAFHLVRDLTVAWLYILRGTWLDLRAGLSITIVVTVCVVWDATLVYCEQWVETVCNRSRAPGALRWGGLQDVPKRGERTGRYLAVAANPSPLPKSMNAVVHLATKDAVGSPWPTGNSGLPRSWQGKLLTMAAVFMVETPRSPKLVNAKH